MDKLEEAQAVLRKYYGYKGFKPIQQKAIASILNGEDTSLRYAMGFVHCHQAYLLSAQQR